MCESIRDTVTQHVAAKDRKVAQYARAVREVGIEENAREDKAGKC